MKTWKRTLLVAASAAVAAAGTAAIPASAYAANSPAPGTGKTGACNMLADPTMGSVAMSNDAPQGNVGMWHAVAVSGC